MLKRHLPGRSASQQAIGLLGNNGYKKTRYQLQQTPLTQRNCRNDGDALQMLNKFDQLLG
jgi:hypothetical protein